MTLRVGGKKTNGQCKASAVLQQGHRLVHVLTRLMPCHFALLHLARQGISKILDAFDDAIQWVSRPCQVKI